MTDSKHIEQAFRSYPDLHNRIKERREWLQAVRHSNSLAPHFRGGRRSAPQERLVLVFDHDQYLSRWQVTADAVERALQLCSARQRQIVQLRYFERMTWDKIADRLHVSSVYLRGAARSKLLATVAPAFCFESVADDLSDKKSPCE